MILVDRAAWPAGAEADGRGGEARGRRRAQGAGCFRKARRQAVGEPHGVPGGRHLRALHHASTCRWSPTACNSGLFWGKKTLMIHSGTGHQPSPSITLWEPPHRAGAMICADRTLQWKPDRAMRFRRRASVRLYRRRRGRDARRTRAPQTRDHARREAGAVDARGCRRRLAGPDPAFCRGSRAQPELSFRENPHCK